MLGLLFLFDDEGMDVISLMVIFKDCFYDLMMNLYYMVFNDDDVIVCLVSFENKGDIVMIDWVLFV